jgi:hypothetical protein
MCYSVLLSATVLVVCVPSLRKYVCQLRERSTNGEIPPYRFFSPLPPLLNRLYALLPTAPSTLLPKVGGVLIQRLMEATEEELNHTASR